jgi:hypothetical protein
VRDERALGDRERADLVVGDDAELGVVAERTPSSQKRSPL